MTSSPTCVPIGTWGAHRSSLWWLRRSWPSRPTGSCPTMRTKRNPTSSSSRPAFRHRADTSARSHLRIVALEPHFAALLPKLVATITPEELTHLALVAFTRPTDPGVQTVHLHERVPVGEQLSLIVLRLRRHGILTFAQLIEDAERTAVVVARFLALLILHRQGSAELDQIEAMGEITVSWCAGQDDMSGMMTSDDLTELEEEFA